MGKLVIDRTSNSILYLGEAKSKSAESSSDSGKAGAKK
jgi:hypothetical protein